jgi:SPP1 gp7 family putative phage head morphogenesis protein
MPKDRKKTRKITALDPTRTITLRNRFVTQFRVRFNRINTYITKSILENDCFDIKKTYRIAATTADLPKAPPKNWETQLNAMKYKELSGLPNNEKVDSFMEWFDNSVAAAIYQETKQFQKDKTVEPVWTNIFIALGYKAGILWARSNIKKAIKTYSDLSLNNDDIIKSFKSPAHVARESLLYSKTITDLKGVTATMRAQIRSTLIEGLEFGWNPKKIARKITERVKKIGIHRATLIARTEIIRAHHLASIQEYRNYEIRGVKVLAEWLTKRDSRVCSLCSPLEGKVFTLDEVEGKIPVHLQCRCATAPVTEDY